MEKTDRHLLRTSSAYRRGRYLVLLSGLMLSVLAATAQTASDSLMPPAPRHEPRHVTPRALVLPAAMFSYGLLSLNVRALKQLNSTVHDRVAVTTNHDPFQVESYLQWTPAVALYGLNFAGVEGNHDLLDRSAIYAMALIVQASFVHEMKNISRETRPNGAENLSFPSGHTANAFTAAELLRREYQGRNPWYGVGGYAVAIATAYLRMVHNKHWLGDVIAGAGVGIFSTDLAYLLYPKVKRLFAHKGASSTLVFPAYQPGGAALVLVHHF